MAIITFKLTDVTPTTYQREDGTFLDTAKSRRLIPEYYIQIKGINTHFKHIRSQVSPRVDKQTKEAVFNPRRDALEFTYGFMLLDDVKDAVSVEFVRNHPYNYDVDNSIRPDGVIPYFKEVQAEKEGLSDIDSILMANTARNLVLELQTKNSDNSFSYKESQISLYAKLFGIDSTMHPSQKVVALVKIAEKDPANFIYKATNSTLEIEGAIEKAIKLDIITFDKKSAFFEKEVIFVSESNITEKEMKREILSYLVGERGVSHNEKLLPLIESKQAQKLQEEKDKKTISESEAKKA